MIIQLDADGILYDLPAKFTQHLGFMYPESSIASVGVADCPEYDFDFIPGVTKEMQSACWESLSRVPGWWEDLPFLLQPSHVARLNALIDADHTIYIATGRPAVNANVDVQVQTLRALARDGLKINYVFAGIGDKAALARDMHADIAIDDFGPHTDNLNEIPGLTVVLYARPYNRGYHQGHVENGGVVVHSFDEFLAMCEREAADNG